MQFEVRATDTTAKLTTLFVEAPDVADARRQALRLRHTPVSIKARSQSGAARHGTFDLTLFAEELQMLLSAGLSLIDAIEGLAERQAADTSRSVFQALATGLRNGDKLSVAMGGQPDVFPPLFVGIVRAAESTSSLPAALTKFVAHESHVRVLRERMTSAAIYPALLLGVGSVVTFFLMVYVVPRFATVYESSGRPLPWVSQLLLEAGGALNQNLAWVLLGFSVITVWTWRLLRRQGAAVSWLSVLALLPGVTGRVQTIELSRLFRTLSMLLEGGLPVREALLLAGEVMFGACRTALADTLRRVEGGEPLSEGLRHAQLSTPLALRLIQVGERSGQLGPMLERAALFHEHETAIWIDRFSKTFGPILMVLISLVVGLIVIFLYIPVFDLAASLQ
jgi:general secretion pathway protein F